MADITPVELFYGGTEVDDGTVPVPDMVDALVGFSGAYAKVARRYQTPDTGHRIRVVGLQRGSAKIFVDIVEWTKANPAAAAALVGAGGLAVTAAGLLGGAAYKVIKDIAGVITGKKALQGAPVTNNSYTFVDNRIILQGVELSKEQLEYLESGELDPDLDRMTRPLEEGRGVDEFKLRTGQEDLASVRSEERRFFSHIETTTTTTRDDIWLEGTLNSHSKRNNRGMFHTLDGKHISYRYVGDDVTPLLRAYAFSGVVKVRGKVKFDSSLNPISIEIHEIQLVQRTLF